MEMKRLVSLSLALIAFVVACSALSIIEVPDEVPGEVPDEVPGEVPGEVPDEVPGEVPDEVVRNLNQNDNPELLKEALEEIESRVSPAFMDEILDKGLYKRVIELITSNHETVKDAAIFTLHDMASVASEEQLDKIIEHGAIENMVDALKQPNQSGYLVVECLQDVLQWRPSSIQLAKDAGIEDIIKEHLQHPTEQDGELGELFPEDLDKLKKIIENVPAEEQK